MEQKYFVSLESGYYSSLSVTVKYIIYSFVVAFIHVNVGGVTIAMQFVLLGCNEI